MKGTRRTWRAAGIIPLFALITSFGYVTHVGALTTGIVALLTVLAIAFRLGFPEAAVAAAVAIAALDFFFMPPIFSFYERDPRDWIASGSFLAIALYLSYAIAHLRKESQSMQSERRRIEQLYLTSRNILMMNRRDQIGSRLANLIAESFHAEGVALWDAEELQLYRAGQRDVPEEVLRAIFYQHTVENDEATSRFSRVLHRGTTPVGALCIIGSNNSGYLDSRSADAVASLAEIALERAHSFLAESSAEAGRRSEQLRSSILDGLAHAFKTPLATIATSSSALLEIRHLDPLERELATLIQEQSLRLADLTSKVLQTADFNWDDFVLDREYIHLGRFLEGCREQAVSLLGDHLLHIEQGTVIESVWADPELLQMALGQLIDNAAKYASPASPITLRAQCVNSDLLFSVTNEGSYIAPEERWRIFERFYRSPQVQYQAPGTGIGLSVTKKIIEAHEGRVWAESLPDAVTTFYLALPQKQLWEV
jgi:two-component system sensor histidine kinase KdpD